MQIHEIYTTIQGEGPFVNRPTVFLRTQTCSVECSYCDVKETWPSRPELEKSIDEILLQTLKLCKQTGTNLLCLTGGTPEEVPGILELIEALQEKGLIVSLEASGAISLKSFWHVNSIVMDIKGPSAGKKAFDATKTVIKDNLDLMVSRRAGNYKYDMLKCVVATTDDLDFYLEVLDDYAFLPVGFSPMFTPKNESSVMRIMAELLFTPDRIITDIPKKWLPYREKLKKFTNRQLNLQIHKMIWPDLTAHI